MMTTRKKQRLSVQGWGVLGVVAMIVAHLLMCARGAHADEVHTAAQSIEDVSIQFIRTGRVYYTDPTGAIANVPIDQVERLSFEGLGRLDDAMRKRHRGDLDGALDDLIMAYLETERDPAHTWIHLQLATLHDRLGDGIQAISHLGAVLMRDSSPVYVAFEPDADVGAGSWYPIAEARHHLTRAARAAANADAPDVVALVDRMLSMIEPRYEEIRASEPRLEYKPGSTISGLLMKEARRGWPGEHALADDLSDTQPMQRGTGRGAQRRGGSADDPSSAASAESSSTSSGSSSGTSAQANRIEGRASDTPGRIDELLARGAYDEALAVCERVIQRPGERDLATLLYQYGAALRGVGRPADAAVRFVQCVAHYRGTKSAVRALIDTALIYRDTYEDEATARRLLDAAMDDARGLSDEGLLRRVREVRSTLSPKVRGGGVNESG